MSAINSINISSPYQECEKAFKDKYFTLLHLSPNKAVALTPMIKILDKEGHVFHSIRESLVKVANSPSYWAWDGNTINEYLSTAAGALCDLTHSPDEEDVLAQASKLADLWHNREK